MLTILEDIKAEAERLLGELRAGVHVAEADLKWLVEKAEDAITIHKAATADSNAENPQPAEGVQVITGSADASAEIPAGYAPIANADPAASVAMPAETAAVNASTECVNAQTACDPTPTSAASAPVA